MRIISSFILYFLCCSIATAEPLIRLNQPEIEGLADPFVIISGTVTDDEQLSQVQVQSDQHSDLIFNALLSGNSFQVEIPLQSGENQLLVTAINTLGSHVTIQTAVSFKAPLATDIVVTSPVENTQSELASITIEGYVVSQFPESKLLVHLGERQQIPKKIDDRYAFRFVDVSLQSGFNPFTLYVDTPDGRVDKVLNVGFQVNSDEILKPVIQISTPASGVVTQNDAVIQGRVISPFNPELVIAGEKIELNERGYFQHKVIFSEVTDAQLDVVLVVTDAFNHSTNKTLKLINDVTAPSLTFKRTDLQFSPVINHTLNEHTILSGEVEGSHFSALMLNDRVVPTERLSEGRYQFNIRLDVPSNENKQFQILAIDTAGNKTARSITVENQAQLDVELVTPSLKNYQIDRGQTSLPVVLRLSQSGHYSVSAEVAGKVAVDLALIDNIAQGELSLVDVQGRVELIVRVYEQGVVVSSLAVPLVIGSLNLDDVLVTAHTPSNGNTLLEPDEPIVLHFNQMVELEHLNIELLETVHGKGYVKSDRSAYFSGQKNELADVHASRSKVPFTRSLLPNQKSVT